MIFAGLRVVTVANISMVSVGAIIGIGGLGELFTAGFQKDFLTPIVVGVVLSLRWRWWPTWCWSGCSGC